MPKSIDQAVLTGALTVAALTAFAANSIICRLALGAGAIDPASFTSVRLLAGAIVLWLVLAWRGHPAAEVLPRRWLSAAMLFVYACGFSYAYVSLTAATGALILFGAVQVTMIGAGLHAGERLRLAQWAGLAIALGGLVALMAPGLSAPAPLGAALMVVAGVAWGVYSLLGRGSGDPLGATAGNFVRAVPFAALLSVALLARGHLSARGVMLATLSGALSSGLGYVIWYAALKRLSSSAAGIAQLAVPPLAALGGALLLQEPIGLRLVACSAVVLGGVAIALLVRRRPT